MSGPGKKLFQTTLQAVTGCDRITALVTALGKHFVPAPRVGSPKNAKELTQLRLTNGNKKIPANTSGVVSKDSLRKSFFKNDIFYEHTPEVHHTTVQNGQITGSKKIGGPSFLKFDLKKKGHFVGIEEE